MMMMMNWHPILYTLLWTSVSYACFFISVPSFFWVLEIFCSALLVVLDFTCKDGASHAKRSCLCILVKISSSNFTAVSRIVYHNVRFKVRHSLYSSLPLNFLSVIRIVQYAVIAALSVIFENAAWYLLDCIMLTSLLACVYVSVRLHLVDCVDTKRGCI